MLVTILWKCRIWWVWDNLSYSITDLLGRSSCGWVVSLSPVGSKKDFCMLVALLLQCRIRGERVAMRKIKKVFENIKPRFGLSIYVLRGYPRDLKLLWYLYSRRRRCRRNHIVPFPQEWNWPGTRLFQTFIHTTKSFIFSRNQMRTFLYGVFFNPTPNAQNLVIENIYFPVWQPRPLIWHV